VFDAGLSGGVQQLPILSHPDALVLAALPAHATLDVGRVRAVLQVVAARSCQGFLEHCRPFLVGFGEPPDLIWRQLQVEKRGAEGLPGVDRVEELLPYVGGQPLLRLARFHTLCLSLCARRHKAQWQPLCQPPDVPWPPLITARTLAIDTPNKCGMCVRHPAHGAEQCSRHFELAGLGPSGHLHRHWRVNRKAVCLAVLAWIEIHT
jgi:hypothetical protein